MEFSKEVESGEPPAERFNGNDEEINGGGCIMLTGTCREDPTWREEEEGMG